MMSSDSQTPFISVVVCVYNEEKYLRQCLEGLLNQTYSKNRYDVLIIENASQDRTQEIADAFIRSLPPDAPNMRMLCIEHVNLSVSRNVGIRYTNGEIIAYIDGDAIPQPAWLEGLAKPFFAGADFTGGRIDLLNTESRVARFLALTRHRQIFGPKIFNNVFVGCNMAFRRSVFSELVGFLENFVSLGDETSLYAKMHGRYIFKNAPHAVVLHEQPDTLAAYVYSEWKSGILGCLVAKASGIQIHWKPILLTVEQFFMASFSICLCLTCLDANRFGFSLFFTAAAVIRRCYLRPFSMFILKGLISEYGWLRGAAAHFVFCYCYNIVNFIGRTLSLWLHRNVKIIQPMTTSVTILKEL